MNVKPLQDRVLIKVEDAETKTSSGLYIPPTPPGKRPRPESLLLLVTTRTPLTSRLVTR